MWPLCSSMRATPLKIITTARRSVHTLIGSKEAFSTRTRAFMIEADITRGWRKVSKFGVEALGVRVPCLRLPGFPWRAFALRPDARKRPTARSALIDLPKLIGGLNKRG